MTGRERSFDGRSPRVVTVVLNTNRRDDTLDCLASLSRQTINATNQIIVLDNHSRDGSAEAIGAAYPSVDLITIDTDRGYAGNNNVGIRKALTYSPEWVFVLNEDTVLEPTCLERMVAAGATDGHVGIVGPLVLHHNEPTVIQSAGGRLGRFWESIHEAANQPDTNQFTVPRDVDWISGCALMIRANAIVQAGMLDESFYYYWEELEWCLRVHKAGWRIVHVPDAKLWHKGVQRDYKPSPNVTYYNTRNRFLMMSRRSAPFYVRCGAWYQTLRTLGSWYLRPKWQAQRAHRDAMVQGVRDYLFANWGVRQQ